jgi:hypothetical protein
MIDSSSARLFVSKNHDTEYEEVIACFGGFSAWSG